MPTTDLQRLKPYCATERDHDLIDTLCTGVSQREAANMLGFSKRTVERRLASIRKRAALGGYSPEHDMDKEASPAHFVKGVSTLYKSHMDDDGNVSRDPVLQWVKTDRKYEEMVEAMREVMETLAEDIIRVEEPPAPALHATYLTDVIPWIQIGDGHIGMMAHACEVGHNFDLNVAEQELCVAITELINEMPPYERVVINDLGDFTHAENVAGVTSASGHQLDMAGPYPSMIKTAVRIMRFIVEKCLSKFRYVDLIVNQGNHSRVNDFWMVELMQNVYENYDRLTILNNGSVFIPYRMGNTFVMTHHSDKCKPPRLAEVMVADYPEDFGESTYRYIDIGHIHHKSVAKEFPGMTIESFNQLAPRDKYAYEGGWRSHSSIMVIERSKTYGEVGRRVLPVEKVKDIIARSMGMPGYFESKRPVVHTV